MEKVIDNNLSTYKTKLPPRDVKFFENKKYFFCKPLEKIHIKDSTTMNPYTLVRDKMILKMIDQNREKILDWMQRYPDPV